jgi:nitrite reductase/ring-hydroxylating ferredoxin subunit
MCPAPNPSAPITRRTVVRQMILGSAVSVLGGLIRPHALFAENLPASPEEGTLSLKISDFPALSSPGGSVRLNVGLDYPVMINRGANNEFHALSTRCTHAGCIVNAYHPALGYILCGCHSSTYRIDGSLRSGPADQALDAYTATYDGAGKISVRLPGVTYAARRITVESVAPQTQRLRIEFNPVLLQTYQLQFRPELGDAPNVVPFALTADGPMVQTSYRNQDYYNPAPTISFFVPIAAPTGFYQIVQVVTEY